MVSTLGATAATAQPCSQLIPLLIKNLVFCLLVTAQVPSSQSFHLRCCFRLDFFVQFFLCSVSSKHNARATTRQGRYHRIRTCCAHSCHLHCSRRARSRPIRRLLGEWDRCWRSTHDDHRLVTPSRSHQMHGLRFFRSDVTVLQMWRISLDFLKESWGQSWWRT